MLNRQPLRADVDTSGQDAQSIQQAARVLRYYGNQTLAFFGLTPHNRHFLATGGSGLVNYQVNRRVAVALGDPICAPGMQKRITRHFLDFCASQQWHVALYQVASEHLATYHSLHMRSFKMGEEAILHPQTFTLQGSALANVRTSCRRAQRDEPVIQWYEGVLPPDVLQDLNRISQIWLDQRVGASTAERGFSMGRMDELTEQAERAEMVAAFSPPSHVVSLVAPRLITVIARTRAGQPCAFMTFTPIYGRLTDEITEAGRQSEMQGWGWTLDLMRRTPDAPPGMMDLLLVQAIERFRSLEAQKLSLGLVAMSDTRQEMGTTEQWLASVSRRMVQSVPGQTLFKFKQKFAPDWESRYLVANATLALPKIVQAVLHLRKAAGDGQD
jgi:phosphatidylglycerol lysyltransferase